MPDHSDQQKAVAIFAQDQFGPEALVYTYGDDDCEYQTPILHAPNQPVEGVTTYSTIGLSEFTQYSGHIPVFVEVLGACDSSVADFPLIISSVLFEHVKNCTNITYGAVLPNIVDQYGLSETLPHLTFVDPFLWEAFRKVELNGKTVHWLCALPISEPERIYLKTEGIDALERMFETCQIDIFNINRANVA